NGPRSTGRRRLGTGRGGAGCLYSVLREERTSARVSSCRAGLGEEFRGNRVTAVVAVDDDPVSECADHAQAPAVLRLLVLALDLRRRAGASVVRDGQGDHLRGYREGQMEAAGCLAAGRVEDRVRAQLADDQLGVLR